MYVRCGSTFAHGKNVGYPEWGRGLCFGSLGVGFKFSSWVQTPNGRVPAIMLRVVKLERNSWYPPIGRRVIEGSGRWFRLFQNGVIEVVSFFVSEMAYFQNPANREHWLISGKYNGRFLLLRFEYFSRLKISEMREGSRPSTCMRLKVYN